MDSPHSNEGIAKQIILREINNVSINTSIIKENGCAACHILFNLMDNMQISESDASDLLSQVLSDDPKLNDRFIEMVEKIHMKQRMMGIPFSIKTREAKDKYIELTGLRQDKITLWSIIYIKKLVRSWTLQHELTSCM